MGRPATQNQARTSVQEHHEARGEAGHDTAATGTNSQGADKPRVQPATQAELMLQAEGDELRCRCCSNPLLPEVLLTHQAHTAGRSEPLSPIKRELLPSQARVLPAPPQPLGFATVGDLSPNRSYAHALFSLGSLPTSRHSGQGSGSWTPLTCSPGFLQSTKRRVESELAMVMLV